MCGIVHGPSDPSHSASAKPPFVSALDASSRILTTPRSNVGPESLGTRCMVAMESLATRERVSRRGDRTSNARIYAYGALSAPFPIAGASTEWLRAESGCPHRFHHGRCVHGDARDPVRAERRRHLHRVPGVRRRAGSAAGAAVDLTPRGHVGIR